MHGIRVTQNDVAAAMDFLDALEEVEALEELQRAMQQQTHGTFRPAGREYRIEVSERGDCCDRGFRRMIRGLARGWTRFRDDHRVLSRIVLGSICCAPPTLALAAVTMVGFARDNDFMKVFGGINASISGLMWLIMMGSFLCSDVEREARPLC